MRKKVSECLRKEFFFFLSLLMGLVIAVLLPLRPSYSMTEKRELAKWPEFTFKEFMDGTYFGGIDLWFSDTFPFRDQMTTANAQVKQYYGFHSLEIHGDSGATGDEIPDIAVNVKKKDTQNETVLETETEVETESEKQGIGADDIDEKVGDGNSDGAAAIENLGAIFVTGKTGYGYYYFTQEQTDRYISMVNRLQNKLKGKASLYDIVVPTAIDLTLDERTRNKISSSNQEKAIQYIYYQMDEDVRCVDIFQNLKAHSDEYIFFRTDHHWTALGAYYAYEEFIKEKGGVPHKLSDYESLEIKGFHGSYYSESGKAASLKDERDTIHAYLPIGTNKLTYTDRKGNTVDYRVVMDVNGWNENALYSAFIGGDNPWSVVENPQITDGSACLLVKESFGNAFAPFLVDHYQYVYIADYRYCEEEISSLVDKYKISDVILMNNVAATSSKSRLNDMEKVYR